MLRKSVMWLSIVSLGLIGAFFLGCGSSSKAPNTACTGGPYDVVGDWQITVSATGTAAVTGYGAIDSAGLALFFDSSGDTLQLPALTGACSYTGSIIAYPEPNSGFSTVTDSITGNVTSASAITGTFSGTSSGTISAATFLPLTGSVAPLSGPMIAELEGGTDILTVTMTPATGNNMTFTGSDTFGCTVSGSFTQVASSNVFDVSYTYSGGDSCAASTSTGIGFESSSDYFGFDGDAATTYFYADILATSGPFVLEFFPECADCDGAHASRNSKGHTQTPAKTSSFFHVL